jgi:hypothetical protein
VHDLCVFYSNGAHQKKYDTMALKTLPQKIRVLCGQGALTII